MAKSLVALVGTKFRGDEAVHLLVNLPQGEPLTLIREPTNKFDRNAVQVWARGLHIGYLKGSQNREIAARMDSAPVTVRITHDNPTSPLPSSFVGKLAIDGGAQPMVEISTGESDG